MNQPIGPNVKKLIIHRMAMLLIPPGTAEPFVSGLHALSDRAGLVAAAQEASRWVQEAIAVVKTCPDNPWADDEAIAGELLRRIAERQQQQKEKHGR